VQRRESHESQVLYEFGTFSVSSGSGSITTSKTDFNHKCVMIIVHHSSYPSTVPTFKIAMRRGASGAYLRQQGSVNGYYSFSGGFPLVGSLKIEISDASADGTYTYEVYYE